MDLQSFKRPEVIPKQTEWHLHHVFNSPSASIPHPYSTRHSTTYTAPTLLLSPYPTSTPTLSHPLVAPLSGATHNSSHLHSTLSSPTPPTPLSSTSHSAHSSLTDAPLHSPYTRLAPLAPITFPSPLVTSTAYLHDDLRHRPSAYLAANKFAYTPHTPLPSSTSHAAYLAPRPVSAPSPYAHPSATNGYTRHVRPSPLDLDLTLHTPTSTYHSTQHRLTTLNPTTGLVLPAGADVPSGYTRALGPPPAEGVGTEHAGLHVFSPNPSLRASQRSVEARGVGGLQEQRQTARLHRVDPITGQWWVEGRGRYATTAGYTGREEEMKEQLTAGVAVGGPPSLANGGVGQMYQSMARRHYTGQGFEGGVGVGIGVEVGEKRGSGYTRNALVTDVHGTRGEKTSGLLSYTRQSHADYRDWADERLGQGEGVRVDEGRTASAYAREETRDWGWGDDGRRVRHFTPRPDGTLDWRTGRQVAPLDQMHRTVRRMGEVLLAEPFPTIKNHGAKLEYDAVDRDRRYLSSCESVRWHGDEGRGVAGGGGNVRYV